ncbi:MAG: hypothetical protein ABIO81_01010, partial [Ginsengibacter sp.]
HNLTLNMIMYLNLLLILLIDYTAACAQNSAYLQPNSKIYDFKNGQWFDGKQFQKATWYSINGILSDIRPSRIDSTLNLNNEKT